MLVKPAKVPSFGARSGGVGSFASWGATSARVMAEAGRAACSAPEASLARSGAVSAARSRSIGHLNLSQPLGSSAARAELALIRVAARKTRTRMSDPIVGRTNSTRLAVRFVRKRDARPGVAPAYGKATLQF